MANEIQQNITISASKNQMPLNASGASSLDIDGSFMSDHVQSIPDNAWTLIDYNTVPGTPRFVLIINLDTTNFIDMASDNAGAKPIGRIFPNGDFLKLSHPQNIYLLANGADCLVRVVVAQQ